MTQYTKENNRSSGAGARKTKTNRKPTGTQSAYMANDHIDDHIQNKNKSIFSIKRAHRLPKIQIAHKIRPSNKEYLKLNQLRKNHSEVCAVFYQEPKTGRRQNNKQKNKASKPYKSRKISTTESNKLEKSTPKIQSLSPAFSPQLEMKKNHEIELLPLQPPKSLRLEMPRIKKKLKTLELFESQFVQRKFISNKQYFPPSSRYENEFIQPQTDTPPKTKPNITSPEKALRRGLKLDLSKKNNGYVLSKTTNITYENDDFQMGLNKVKQSSSKGLEPQSPNRDLQKIKRPLKIEFEVRIQENKSTPIFSCGDGLTTFGPKG